MKTVDQLLGAKGVAALLGLLFLLAGCGATGRSSHSARGPSHSGHASTATGQGAIDALVPIVVSFEGQLPTADTTDTMVRTPRVVPSTGPIVDLWLENDSQASESIGYDVFVASQPPPSSLNTYTVTLPSQWPGMVWDFESVSGTADTATDVLPGDKIAKAVAWPATTTAGAALPPGDYWVVVWATVNGSPFAFDWYWPYFLQ